MGRMLKFKRRLIYRLGALLSSGRLKEEKNDEERRRQSKRRRAFQLVLFFFLLFSVLFLAGRRLYRSHRSRIEPMARLELYQEELDEASRLHDKLLSENESLQKSFDQTRDEMLFNFNYSNPENQALLEAYREALVMGGMTEYQGPGLRITLQDKEERSEDAQLAITQIVHDADLRYIVDLLKRNYVSAIAVNDERLAPMSPLICTGPSVLVNRVYKASPFVIEAGTADPEAVLADFYESEGYKRFKERGLRITAESLEEMRIAAQRDMSYVNAQVEKLEAKK